MKITVLGSGGFGYPLVFCDCELCSAARKLGGKNIRKRASLLIDDKILIDLTPDTTTAFNMYGKDMANVEYLLQTHTHLDHFDLNHFTTLDFKYALKLKNKLHLVCSELCFEDIAKKASIYDTMNLHSQEYLQKINLEPNIINHGQSLKMGGYEIKAIHTLHDEKLGAQLYLIKHNNSTLFYATDTNMITPTALQELDGEKIDCMFLDESFGVNSFTFSHLNIKAFGEFINELKNNNLLSDNCKIYATHITHDKNPLHEDLNEILKQYNSQAAYDGLELEI